MEIIIIIQAFWLIIPVYIANASAVIMGGGKPIDFNKKYKDGNRLLGDGKTWRGLLAGTFIGMTGGFGLSVAAKMINNSSFEYLGLSTFLGFPFMIIVLFSLCFGALLGDIIESFFKRRIGKDRGENWYAFDQLDFIAGALFFSLVISELLNISGLVTMNWFLETFTIWHIIFLIILTPVIHIIANTLNNYVKSRVGKNI